MELFFFFVKKKGDQKERMDESAWGENQGEKLRMKEQERGSSGYAQAWHEQAQKQCVHLLFK